MLLLYTNVLMKAQSIYIEMYNSFIPRQLKFTKFHHSGRSGSIRHLENSKVIFMVTHGVAI